MGDKCSKEPEHHYKRAAKSSKHRQSLPERTTSTQNEVSEENIEEPEAFWNNVLWTDETNILLFGQRKRVMSL